MAFFRFETERRSLLATMERPSKLVLRGRIVTMDAAGTVIADGVVALDGTRIVQVSPWSDGLAPGFESMTPFETKGTIYPGLVELHNHPSYNALPLWQPPRLYANRSEWRKFEPDYTRKVANPAALLTHDPTSDLAKSVVRFVECRALLGGVTTTQGLSVTHMPTETQAEYRGLVRNLELPDDPGWPTATDQINDFESVKEANAVYGPILGDRQRPFIMHLSEGTDQAAHDVFECLRRPDGSRLIGDNLVGVHGTGLDPTQLAALKAAGGLVWSPLSNFLLYGATTDIEAAKAAGVQLSLGCDWAPSGTKNLLGELKIAKLVSDHKGGVFSDLELARMVTSTPAQTVGWDSHIGSIEVGKRADLLVLEGATQDPYRQMVEAREDSVVAVLIDGRPRLGRATIIDPRTDGVELARVAGQDMTLDIVEAADHPLAKTTLNIATATLAQALEHLPDLAAQFAAKHDLLDGATSAFVRLDMDEAHAMSLVLGRASIGRDDVDPMHLDPITSVDDASFIARIKTNNNIPAWLREAL